MHADLLNTARRLLCPEDGQTLSQADLRRAVSTAYYGLFHHVSRPCADLLVAPEGKFLSRAKTQVYRSIDHRDVIAACHGAKTKLDFPQPIADYAVLFLNMYKSRCNADYDPSPGGDFHILQALHKIGEVDVAIKRFDSVHIDDRRAFAVLVAVKKPKWDRK